MRLLGLLILLPALHATPISAVVANAQTECFNTAGQGQTVTSDSSLSCPVGEVGPQVSITTLDNPDYIAAAGSVGTPGHSAPYGVWGIFSASVSETNTVTVAGSGEGLMVFTLSLIYRDVAELGYGQESASFSFNGQVVWTQSTLTCFEPNIDCDIPTPPTVVVIDESFILGQPFTYGETVSVSGQGEDPYVEAVLGVSMVDPTPAPEPSTWTVMITSLVGLLLAKSYSRWGSWLGRDLNHSNPKLTLNR